MRTPVKKVYKTMQGKTVDIEKLRQQNETTVAVGNMNVNARGDVLGKGGAVVQPKANVIQKYYEQPKGRVDDTPTRARPTPVRRTPPAAQPKITRTAPVESKPQVAKKTQATEKKGIDAALDGIE